MSEHSNPSNPSKVVVIGGGYVGTLAANRLRTRADVDITLVNPRPKFVERIRLHQFVARTGDATIDYGTLLSEGIQLVVDSATRIDTTARTVQLASGRELDYDYVIYAVGSTGAETIAAAVDKPVVTVGQVAHRAREHVRARRKRFEPVNEAETARITEQFMTAATTGDLKGLLARLAPEAIWTADSVAEPPRHADQWWGRRRRPRSS
jgi:NADH dehydrogenase FAD-containing subunit